LIQYLVISVVKLHMSGWDWTHLSVGNLLHITYHIEQLLSELFYRMQFACLKCNKLKSYDSTVMAIMILQLI